MRSRFTGLGIEHGGSAYLIPGAAVYGGVWGCITQVSVAGDEFEGYFIASLLEKVFDGLYRATTFIARQKNTCESQHAQGLVT